MMSSSLSLSTSLGVYFSRDSDQSVAIVGESSTSSLGSWVDAPGRVQNLDDEQAESDLPIWSKWVDTRVTQYFSKY